MNQRWKRTACIFVAAMLLCCAALPALAETDATLNAFKRYAKTLQGKGASFKYSLPDVFEGKTVIGAFYDLNSDPVMLSTKTLEEEGDFWLIPSELLAANIKEADWALLVYVSDEDGYGDWPITVSCFAVDVKNGVYYEPFEIYSRDTLIGNDERTYELNGTLAGIDEFVLYHIWSELHGGEEKAGGDEAESEFDESYLQGLEYLKEEKYFSAYEAFNASWSEGAYEQAQACIKPWPKNGEVWRTSQGKGEKFDFTIKVNQSADQGMLLRFFRKGFPISSVFIGGTGTVTIPLPAGEYTVKSGQGTDWFGVKESFGRNGSYQTMTFEGAEEIKLQAGYAYTLSVNTSEKTPNSDAVGSEYESWEGFSD